MSRARNTEWNEEIEELELRFQEDARAAHSVLDNMQARAEGVCYSLRSLQSWQAGTLGATALIQMHHDSWTRAAGESVQAQNDTRYVSRVVQS